MAQDGGFEVIRDPLWDNIRLEPAAVQAIDTGEFQRLRYVRQLGHTFHVYPGATHSRFEHALGTYHLARRTLALLAERDSRVRQGDDAAIACAAAVLHDIGHYPFSHALEEAGFPSHESLGIARLATGRLGDLLRSLGGEWLIHRIGELIEGSSDSPLAGLVSGSLDLDKIDCLSRDAHMCGVPYGTVDVNRLLSSLVMVADASTRLQVGVHEKGLSALESLLFGKYQMYRNVYWHHAVRSATAMFQRAVRATLRAGRITVGEVSAATDDAFATVLAERDPTGLARALRARRLHKRALDLAASELPADLPDWLWNAPDTLELAEDKLAADLGLPAGAVLIDFPARESMLSVDLPLLARSGEVERLTSAGRSGQLGLPRVADELYRTARRLRIFTAEPRRLDEIPRALRR